MIKYSAIKDNDFQEYTIFFSISICLPNYLHINLSLYLRQNI